MGREHNYYHSLDSWLSGWVPQYTDIHANTLESMLESLHTNQFSEEDELAFDLVLHECSVEKTAKDLAVWFSTVVQDRMDLRAKLLTVQPYIHANVYGEHAQPFVEATQRTWNFLAVCRAIHDDSNALPHEATSQLFNLTYGGVKGFLDAEETVRNTYGFAAALGEHLRMYKANEDLEFRAAYMRFIEPAEHMRFMAVFHGIDNYRPTVVGDKLQLSTPSGTFEVNLNDI